MRLKTTYMENKYFTEGKWLNNDRGYAKTFHTVREDEHRWKVHELNSRIVRATSPLILGQIMEAESHTASPSVKIHKLYSHRTWSCLLNKNSLHLCTLVYDPRYQNITGKQQRAGLGKPLEVGLSVGQGKTWRGHWGYERKYPHETIFMVRQDSGRRWGLQEVTYAYYFSIHQVRLQWK